MKRLLVALAALLLVAGCGSHSSSTAPNPSPVDLVDITSPTSGQVFRFSVQQTEGGYYRLTSPIVIPVDVKVNVANVPTLFLYASPLDTAHTPQPYEALIDSTEGTHHATLVYPDTVAHPGDYHPWLEAVTTHADSTWRTAPTYCTVRIQLVAGNQ